MEVNRYIELLGAFVDRPELLEVEKLAIRHAVQHRALESELGNGAIELVSGGLRIDGRQGGKGGKTLGIGRANLGKSIIDLTGEAGGDVSSELLGGRRAVREHLDVDACRIHLLEAQAAEIKEPFVRFVAPASFRTGEMLGQFRIPVVFLDGNNRTIRLLHHGISPRLYCLKPFPSNGGGDCHGPRWPAAHRPVTNKPHTRGWLASRVQAGLWYWSRLSYAQAMLPILRILPVGGVLLAIFILILALSPPDGSRAPLNSAMAPARGALVDRNRHPEVRQFLILAALKRADELNRLRELPDTPTRTEPAT